VNMLGAMLGVKGGDPTSSTGRAAIQEAISRVMDCPSNDIDPAAVLKVEYIYNHGFGDRRAYLTPPTSSLVYRKQISIAKNVLVAMDINPAKTTSVGDSRFDRAYGTSGNVLLGASSTPIEDRPLDHAGNPHGGGTNPKKRTANMLFMSGQVVNGIPQYIEEFMGAWYGNAGDPKKPLPWPGY